jgi:NAD(P)-dependent dehydrogenase (short-subunit alcohol dehydrogenase family)
LNDDGDFRQSAANEVSKITGGKLDYLINNAAILNPDRAGLTTLSVDLASRIAMNRLRSE